MTKYAEHVRALKPDLVVALADEIDSTLGKNRQMQSVSTTLTWLEEFIQIQQKLDRSVYSVSDTYLSVYSSVYSNIYSNVYSNITYSNVYSNIY